MNLEMWLEEQNTLTVGDDPNFCVKLLDAQEQVWATWPVPVKAETVHTFLAGMRDQLATGRHAFTLVSYAEDGDSRARFMKTLDGNSSAAKAAQTDEVTRAKATSMNIDIAERQLVRSDQRLAQSEERNAKLEERMFEQAEIMWKFADRIAEIDREDRRFESELEERQARIQMLKGLAEAATPILGFLMPMLSKKLEAVLAPQPPSTAPEQVSSPSLQTAAPEPEKTIDPPAVDDGPAWPTAAAQQAEEEPVTEVASEAEVVEAEEEPEPAPAEQKPPRGARPLGVTAVEKAAKLKPRKMPPKAGPEPSPKGRKKKTPG